MKFIAHQKKASIAFTTVLAAFAGLALPAAQIVSLDGEWRLDYFPQPDDGAVRSIPLPDGMDVKSIKASVPGNCELDLMNAGILPPLEVGMNTWLLRPYEGYQWLYSREFTAPELKSGEQLRLGKGGRTLLYMLNCI